jgi:lactate dehydrogenase-like 2-hydroxyacid dehydrogenase
MHELLSHAAEQRFKSHEEAADEDAALAHARAAFAHTPAEGASGDGPAAFTSHQAYYTEDAVAQINDATVRNVLDYKAGRRSENVLVAHS